MTVRELLRRVSSRELSEWMAYEKIAGPLGGRRDDVLTGLIVSAIYNANRGKKSRAIKPEATTPTWGRRRTQTPEEMWANAMALNKEMGGTTVTPD